MTSDTGTKIGRREFIGAAAGAMIVGNRLVRGTAANSDVRVGLLGCGGRGTEDTSNLVDTGSARVVALADLFQDQLDKAKQHFDALGQSKGHAPIDRSQMFVGPKAFEQIANSKEVDAIVITSPPYFHPQHLETVVAAGKHVYCEKPVAVDVAGANRVIEAGKNAQGRLSLDVGFQIRNAPPFVELAKRVHGGALGTIACGEAYYYGTTLERPAWPNASTVRSDSRSATRRPSSSSRSASTAEPWAPLRAARRITTAQRSSVRRGPTPRPSDRIPDPQRAALRRAREARPRRSPGHHCVRRGVLLRHNARASGVAQRLDRRAPNPQLGVGPRVVRRYHRRAEHPRHRRLQLDAASASHQGSGRGRAQSPHRQRRRLRPLQRGLHLSQRYPRDAQLHSI